MSPKSFLRLNKYICRQIWGVQRSSSVTLLCDWPPLSALGRGRPVTAPAAQRPLRCTVKTAVITGFQIRVSKPETFVTAPEKVASRRSLLSKEGLESRQIQRESRNTVADSRTALHAVPTAAFKENDYSNKTKITQFIKNIMF